jgi:hypothetical protein
MAPAVGCQRERPAQRRGGPRHDAQPSVSVPYHLMFRIPTTPDQSLGFTAQPEGLQDLRLPAPLRAPHQAVRDAVERRGAQPGHEARSP